MVTFVFYRNLPGQMWKVTQNMWDWKYRDQLGIDHKQVLNYEDYYQAMFSFWGK